MAIIKAICCPGNAYIEDIIGPIILNRLCFTGIINSTYANIVELPRLLTIFSKTTRITRIHGTFRLRISKIRCFIDARDTFADDPSVILSFAINLHMDIHIRRFSSSISTCSSFNRNTVMAIAITLVKNENQIGAKRIMKTINKHFTCVNVEFYIGRYNFNARIGQASKGYLSNCKKNFR